jgi:hypothetical protein
MSTAAPFSTATDHAPAAASVAPAMRCENCGAAVTGRYCSACGQRLEPPVHSLWHFTQLAIEDLTHADSRLWRTLAALLFKPADARAHHRLQRTHAVNGLLVGRL